MTVVAVNTVVDLLRVVEGVGVLPGRLVKEQLRVLLGFDAEGQFAEQQHDGHDDEGMQEHLSSQHRLETCTGVGGLITHLLMALSRSPQSSCTSTRAADVRMLHQSHDRLRRPKAGANMTTMT